MQTQMVHSTSSLNSELHTLNQFWIIRTKLGLASCLNKGVSHKCVSVALVTCKLVSDLEADHAQQQEGREEGVEENKV